MKIIVKESDRLMSTTHRGKYFSEYLVYLKADDNVRVECFDLIGEKQLKNKIAELGQQYDIDFDDIMIVPYEEFMAITFE